MNVDFVTAIKLFFANYVNFKGRSTRAEYWFAALFCFIASIVANGIGSLIHWKYFASLVSLALFLPQLSVLVRRFHDTGRSGKVVAWIYAVCIIGAIFCGLGVGALGTWATVVGGIIAVAACIYMLVVTVTPSGPDNQYGPDPYAYEKNKQ